MCRLRSPLARLQLMGEGVEYNAMARLPPRPARAEVEAFMHRLKARVLSAHDEYREILIEQEAWIREINTAAQWIEHEPTGTLDITIRIGYPESNPQNFHGLNVAPAALR